MALFFFPDTLRNPLVILFQVDYTVSTNMNMDINQKSSDNDVVGIITMPSHTTLKVSKELTDELKLVGRKGETYEQIIWGMLNERKKSAETYEKLAESVDKLRSAVERQDKKK
jgi:hypothetical protein